MIFKKFIGFFIGTILAFGCAYICRAESNVIVKVDDNAVVFEQQQLPIIENGRTLIPLRGVFDVLDCDVEWDSVNKNVLIKKNNDMVLVKIGDKNIYKNGVVSAVIDTPAQIINGRTMIPIRGIFELFDNYVGWDEEERTVEIYTTNGDEVFLDMKDVSEANRAMKILENNSSVQKVQNYLNGTKVISIYSKDAEGNLISHILDSSFEGYYNSKACYEKNSDGEVYFITYIFDDDKKDNYLPSDIDVAWTFNDNEKVIFAVEKNGKYYVKTEIADVKLIDGFSENYNVENNGKYICRFIADADTLRIISMEDYQVINGVERRISGIDIKNNVIDSIPKFVSDIENSADKRKITLVVDSGTLEEKTIMVEVDKNTNFSFFGIENYNIYNDKRCTIPYNATNYDKISDIILYLKK